MSNTNSAAGRGCEATDAIPPSWKLLASVVMLGGMWAAWQFLGIDDRPIDHQDQIDRWAASAERLQNTSNQSQAAESATPTTPPAANTQLAAAPARVNETTATAANSRGAAWANFRGSGQGTVNRPMPTQFHPDSIHWTTPLPGRGSSTPITINDRVFLTSYSGFGEKPGQPGRVDQLRLHLICLDAKSGEPIWMRDIAGNPVVQSRVSQNLAGHGFASSTPVTDGKHVFAFFGASGVFAFDWDGNFLWQQDVGWEQDNFGSSASLTLFENLLIVNASVQSDTVFALDCQTGRGVWKIDDVHRSWSTPAIGQSESGRDELVIVQEDLIRGFDPRTGIEYWQCEGIHDYTVPTPVFSQGIAIINGGQQPRTIAVRLGGLGNVDESHRLWEARVGANVTSSIIHEQRVFNVHETGLLQCLDLETGRVIKRTRIKNPGVVYASPTLVTSPDGKDNRLLVLLQDSRVATYRADDTLEFIGVSQIDPKAQDLKASLAVAGNQWLTRTDRHCYAITQSAAQQTEASHPQSTTPLIASKPKFDFDADKKRVRIYNRCLSPNTEDLVQFILVPYDSVLTEDQKVAFRKIVLENTNPFDLLRNRRRQAIWQLMQREQRDDPSALALLQQIETDTMAAQRDVRTIIKRDFSPEQMAAHMAEVETMKNRK